MKKYENYTENISKANEKTKENKPLLTLIFGIVGEMSAGKEAAAKYLESKYNFRCINIDKLNENFDEKFLNEENEIDELEEYENIENKESLKLGEEQNIMENNENNENTSASNLEPIEKNSMESKNTKTSEINKERSNLKNKTSNDIVKVNKNPRKMSGNNKPHNKLVDLITLSYELNDNKNPNDNSNNKLNENEYENLEEKNLSICLSTSIIEYDNREKVSNLLKETIRDITDNFAVIHPLKKLQDFEELNRNYFRLININAPAKKRFQNYIKKHGKENKNQEKNSKSDYENFLDDDERYYLENKDIKEMQTYANYHISNDGTLEDLKFKLDELSSTLHQTFRPNWDDYFMKITIAVSERSNCMKQRIGALLVRDFRIISTGYNGMSSSLGNCYLGNCPRCNIKARQGENLHNCICIHAEESAIVELGTLNCKGAILYTTNYPCIFCTKIIIKAEIKEIVYFREYYSEYTAIMLEKAGIKIKKWNKPENHY